MKKTILVTGSTDGIGKIVAMDFARDGHEVIIHGRNASKVQKVVKDIIGETSNNSVKGYIADFSDFTSITALADKLMQEVSKIDILINNAGVFKSKLKQNKNGLDLRMMVNYLAPYLFTKKVLPLLNKARKARIINLSSAAQSPVSVNILEGKAHSSENSTYAQSKLALTMWSFDLASQLNDIAVIAVNPGSLLNTRMANEAYGTFWSSATKGSDILYQLALNPKFDNASGKYFDNDNASFNQAHPDSYDRQKIATLIEKTDEIINKFI